MSTYANQARNMTPHSGKKRAATILSIIATVLIGTLMAFHNADAQTPSRTLNLKQALSEMSIGKPDAPVTLYEYASLTCPHCARFHAGTLPLIEKNFVETGKVRIVFRDFPLGGLATGALMVVRCTAPERRIDFYGMLFDTQSKWARSQNPMASIIALARFFGMQKDDVDACLSNQALLTSIQNNAKGATARYGLDSTPSFVLNNKVVAVGDLGYKKFAAILNKALAAKGIK